MKSISLLNQVKILVVTIIFAFGIFLLLPDFVLGQAGVGNKGLVSTTCVSGWGWKQAGPPTDAGGTDSVVSVDSSPTQNPVEAGIPSVMMELLF